MDRDYYRPRTHFNLIHFLTLCILSYLDILNINPLSNVQLAKILSLSMGFFFGSLLVSFGVQRLVFFLFVCLFHCFLRSHLSIVDLNFYTN